MLFAQLFHQDVNKCDVTQLSKPSPKEDNCLACSKSVRTRQNLSWTSKHKGRHINDGILVEGLVSWRGCLLKHLFYPYILQYTLCTLKVDR